MSLPFPPTTLSCSIILRTTFQVESTFGINHQTRLLTGLWKHHRLAIRLHKKVNVGSLRSEWWCVCLVCSVGAWMSAAWAAALGNHAQQSLVKMGSGQRLWLVGSLQSKGLLGVVLTPRNPVPSRVGKRFICWIWVLYGGGLFFLNKVLLEHNHEHFFTCLWLLSCYKGRIE